MARRHFMMIFFSSCLLLAALPAWAGDGLQLQAMSKEDNLESTVLHLTFSSMPVHRVETSGQRIDMMFADTDVSSALTSLPEGGPILHLLLAKKNQELIISILLAQIPQSVKVLTSGNSKELRIRMVWLGRSNAPQPAITGGQPGTPQTNAQGSALKLAIRSRYGDDWKRFFADYSTPLTWHVPMTYDYPAFEVPACAHPAQGSPLAGVCQERSAGHWPQVLKLVAGIEGDKVAAAERPSFLLLYTEALVRNGRSDFANDLYRQAQKGDGAAPVLEAFRELFAALQARAGHPYAAASILEVPAGQSRTLQPPPLSAVVLKAELLLDTQRPQQALTLLNQVDEARSNDRIHLLIADALAALGHYREAGTLYSAWLTHHPVTEMDGFSLAWLGMSSDFAGDWQLAEKAFQQLAAANVGPEIQALALYAVGRMAEKAGDLHAAAQRYDNVIRSFADTEGAQRARLRTLDWSVTDPKNDFDMNSAKGYRLIATSASNWALREEAAFKEALVNALLGQAGLAIEELMAFRREFSSSGLRPDAEALLVEKLQPWVLALIRGGQPLTAVTLVEQNRELLAATTLQPEFVSEVATAFKNLGLLQEAAHIYRYLLDVAADSGKAEQFYPPLVDALYSLGRYREVLSLVERYQKAFPDGDFAAKLKFFQGEAYLAVGRLQEAGTVVAALSAKDPAVAGLRDRVELALAARDGIKSPELSTLSNAAVSDAGPAAKLLHAEELYKDGRPDEALPLYQELTKVEPFADQANYRSGEILILLGERAQGLNYLRTLAEKGKDAYWQALGRIELTQVSER